MTYDYSCLLNQLESAPLLENVGDADREFEFEISERKLAVKSASSKSWENFTCAMVYSLYDRLGVYLGNSSEDPERLADQINADLEGVAQRLWNIVSPWGDSCSSVHSIMVSHLFAALLEAKYRDRWNLCFMSTRIIPIYLKGRMPCGWKGDEVDYPYSESFDREKVDGVPVVY